MIKMVKMYIFKQKKTNTCTNSLPFYCRVIFHDSVHKEVALIVAHPRRNETTH